MKPSLFLFMAVLLFSSVAAYCQQSPSLLLSMEAKRRPHFGADTSRPETFQQLMDLQRMKKGGLINATFSHNTARGKVYNLSPDNMPCLVPNQKAVATMPNGFRGVNPDKKMNRMPEVRIIPLITP